MIPLVSGPLRGKTALVECSRSLSSARPKIRRTANVLSQNTFFSAPFQEPHEQKPHDTHGYSKCRCLRYRLSSAHIHAPPNARVTHTRDPDGPGTRPGHPTKQPTGPLGAFNCPLHEAPPLHTTPGRENGALELIRVMYTSAGVPLQKANTRRHSQERDWDRDQKRHEDTSFVEQKPPEAKRPSCDEVLQNHLLLQNRYSLLCLSFHCTCIARSDAPPRHDALTPHHP